MAKFSAYLNRHVFVMNLSDSIHEIITKEKSATLPLSTVLSTRCIFSQIFTLKFTLRQKLSLDWAMAIVKWFFGLFVSEIIFLLFFPELNHWCSTTKLLKFQRKRKVELVKIGRQVNNPKGFCVICIHFHFGKKWKYLFVFLNQWLE